MATALIIGALALGGFVLSRTRVAKELNSQRFMPFIYAAAASLLRRARVRRRVERVARLAPCGPRRSLPGRGRRQHAGVGDPEKILTMRRGGYRAAAPPEAASSVAICAWRARSIDSASTRAAS